jgi:hypothetical protein
MLDTALAAELHTIICHGKAKINNSITPKKAKKKILNKIFNVLLLRLTSEK